MKSFQTVRPLAALAALLALALPSPAANRQEMVFSFSFKEGAVTYAPQPDGTLLPVLEGAELPVGNPGKPWLAVKEASVKLPVGWKAVAVEATAERRLIREGIDVTPEQEPRRMRSRARETRGSLAASIRVERRRTRGDAP